MVHFEGAKFVGSLNGRFHSSTPKTVEAALITVY